MADGRRQVEQVVKLNTRQYVEPLRQLRNESRTAFNQINKTLFESGGRFSDYSNQIKKGAAGLVGSLADIGKSFARNVGHGALAGTGVGAVFALRDQMSKTVETGMKFGKAFAHLASRANLSSEKIKELRRQVKELGKTGADLESLPVALNDIFGVTGDVDVAMSVMDPIAKVAAMGNGNASDVAEFVKNRLTGEGRDINRANVDELLQSVVSAQRGGDFKSLEEAMQSISGIDAVTKQQSGLSDKEVASLLAGATRAGGIDTKTGVAGISALMRASANPIQSSALAGILGVGSLTKDGKLDISKLGQSGVRQRIMGLGGDEAQSREIFKGISGLSETEANAVFSFIKNFESMNKGIETTMNDTKTLEQSFSESTDNLSDGLQRLRNNIVTGIDSVIGPLESVGSKLLKGQFTEGLKALPNALQDSFQGVMDNKELVAGGLAATALTGIIARRIGGMVGGSAGLASGVGMGKALEQMGVQPVYVVNASDIASGVNKAGMDKISELLGAGAGAAGTASSPIAKALGLAGKATGAAAAGAAGYMIGDQLINPALDKYTQGKTEEGFEGNVVERLFFKLDKVADGMLSGTGGAKFKVEVESKDPQYMARPKATDLDRDGK